MTALNIGFAGPFVSVQDAGRPGFMRFGVPQSGPMDRAAFSILQAALDTDTDFSAIEVSVGGLTLKTTGAPVTAGFVGGDFLLDLGGEKLAPWSIFTLPPETTLTIRPGASGSWGYLGFCGKIDSAEWLGSHAMHLTSGLCGRSLRAGDQLQINNAQNRADLAAALPQPKFADFDGRARVVIGPQERFFDAAALSALSTDSFTITQDYDRMGMRLSGASLAPKAELTMPSEALLRGSVQVPGHGDPIILLADHQTTGGYPKIATVITADQDRITQARARDAIRFEPVTAEQATAATRYQNTCIRAYIDAIPGHRGTLSERLNRMNLISGVVGPG